MKVLIVFNRQPYDNTDVTWNGLRLAGKLLESGQEVRLFLMNDSVDMARDAFDRLSFPRSCSISAFRPATTTE